MNRPQRANPVQVVAFSRTVAATLLAIAALQGFAAVGVQVAADRISEQWAEDLEGRDRIAESEGAGGVNFDAATFGARLDNAAAGPVNSAARDEIKRQCPVNRPCPQYYVQPTYVQPTYVQPAQVRPAVVQPTYVQPAVPPAPIARPVVPQARPAPTPVQQVPSRLPPGLPSAGARPNVILLTDYSAEAQAIEAWLSGPECEGLRRNCAIQTFDRSNDLLWARYANIVPGPPGGPALVCCDRTGAIVYARCGSEIPRPGPELAAEMRSAYSDYRALKTAQPMAGDSPAPTANVAAAGASAPCVGPQCPVQPTYPPAYPPPAYPAAPDAYGREPVFPRVNERVQERVGAGDWLGGLGRQLNLTDSELFLVAVVVLGSAALYYRRRR